MSEPKWTPGPWHACGDYIFDGTNSAIPLEAAWKEGRWANDPVALANVTLISAAPELYEALSGLMALRQFCDEEEDGELFDIAASALAKARGDTP